MHQCISMEQNQVSFIERCPIFLYLEVWFLEGPFSEVSLCTFTFCFPSCAPEGR